jgi:hypothetical protein
MKPKKETPAALRRDRDDWKAIAEERGDIISALRAELAAMQDSYHLLNEAVARVLKTTKGEKR